MSVKKFRIDWLQYREWCEEGVYVDAEVAEKLYASLKDMIGYAEIVCQHSHDEPEDLRRARAALRDARVGFDGDEEE